VIGRRVPIVIAITALVAAASAAGAWQQRPTFQLASNIVEVFATVTDRGGRLVTGLTQADFEVRDNGRTQPIAVFEAASQPVAIAVLLDESPSLFESSARLKAAVSVFANALLPGDRATLGAFSHIVRIEPKLTGNLASLANRLDDGRPRFPAGTALWDAIDAGADALAAAGGRRVVLVLTDGEDNCSRLDPGDVRARIEGDGTMVYAVGVRGDGGLPASELRTLARESGGYYFQLKPAADLIPTFTRVADELHRQYLIGYSAPNLDGRSHTISVKLKKSGLTARARSSYIATKADGGGR
jgi:Ca-activated chloride channel homolog